MTAPSSVQKLTPEIWLDVWEHVCKENVDWFEMRTDAGSGTFPYCRICETWSGIAHLQSGSCRSGIKPGPVLAAILEAESECCRASATPLGTSEASSGLQVELVDGIGICAKPGCNNRAPGRVSRTHCCKRCQLAHAAGVGKLNHDPVTGERWKQAHGAECTMHCDKRRVVVRARELPVCCRTGVCPAMAN